MLNNDRYAKVSGMTGLSTYGLTAMIPIETQLEIKLSFSSFGERF